MVTIIARFTTSTISATPAALETLTAAGITPGALFARHNEQYLRDGEGMLLSVFADVPGGPVCVISHIGYGKNLYMTMLLPEEYS